MVGSLGGFHKPTRDSTEGATVSLETEQDGDVDPGPGFEAAGWKSEVGKGRSMCGH